ncbi:nitroreductase family protein [Parahaliea mediterranea]|uniref:Putative NAD(P)H nitroreductase n=1 Tax=Parahaliea mediterranea TaxID=651086 RepID=A0A939DGU2_9GAMM|nr:nitroreductase family protein [Parahaliea mediterranea]MBN7798008.1 nitroreductase family protein [Parahaliea mediterranea]
MSEVLKFLQQRNSAAKLEAPGPGEAELREMIVAATRVPDHAWLRPWRFLTIAGERRRDFGEVLERCLLERDPAADEAARQKARNAPLRAPLLLVVVARISEHPKVPAVEQRLSAGCAAQAILLAAEAQGFAGIWRTGAPAFDRRVMAALGLAPNEEIVGFLYLGTRAGRAKPLPELPPDSYLNHW